MSSEVVVKGGSTEQSDIALKIFAPPGLTRNAFWSAALRHLAWTRM
jgi:hypothetical protein